MKISFFKTLMLVSFLVPVYMAAETNSNPEPQKPPVVTVQPAQQRCRVLCPLTAIKNAIAAHPRIFCSFLTVSLLAGAGVGGYYLYQSIIADQENAADEKETVAAQESTGNEIADRLSYCTVKNLHV